MHRGATVKVRKRRSRLLLFLAIVVLAAYAASIAPRFRSGYWFSGVIQGAELEYREWAEDIGIAGLPFEEAYPLLSQHLRSNGIDVFDLFLTERDDGMHWVSTFCFIKVPEADRKKMLMLAEDDFVGRKAFWAQGEMRFRPVPYPEPLGGGYPQYPNFYWPPWLPARYSLLLRLRHLAIPLILLPPLVVVWIRHRRETPVSIRYDSRRAN